MNDEPKTPAELIEEISALKQRIKQLRKSESEHRQTAEALKKSEEQYRILSENSPSMIFLLDPEANVIVVNQRSAARFGVNPDAIIGRNVRDLFPKPIAERHIQAIKKIVQDGQTIHSELYESFPTGDRWIDARLAPVRDGNGAVVAVLGISHDITDRKLAEEALRESESRYRRIVEMANEGVWELDERFTITYVNRRMAEMLGYSPEEIVGRPVSDFMVEEDIPHHALRREIRRKGGVESFERRFLRKDGTTCWTLVAATPLNNEAGQFTGSFSMFADITEHKRVEKELRASEEKYRSLASTADYMFLVDSDCRYRFANENFLATFGPMRDEVLGEQYSRFHDDEDVKVFTDVVRSVIETGNSRQDERRGIRTRRYFLRTLSPVKDAEGNITAVTVVSKDITERKKAEDENRRLKERLERAQKMEALGTLAGGVAHDLNNVLGVVVGYSELLLQNVERTSAIRFYAENIMKGGERAAVIVQDMLTLARRGLTDRKVLNLNTVVADCEGSPEFEKLTSFHTSVRIRTDLDPDLLNISGSPVHLGKTLFNLISNACEAMPNGGAVTVRTANQYLDRPIRGYDDVREGDYAVLTVSDAGEGIPAADLEHIFEPFYTKKVMGRSGTGLGLAVVWGTVKDHEGYINVQSTVGKGSTFTLYFPVTRKEISPERSSVSMSSYMGKGESILIVDDVKEQRDLAAEMLRRLNYAVTCVSSGEEAVAYLKGHTVDLLVLDMIMDPGIDGFDTYRRALDIRPNQKAIIVSGYSETERVNAARVLGVGAYVRKPYVIEKMGLAVREELDRAI